MRAILTLLGAMLALLPACGPAISGMTVAFNAELEEAINELRKTGGSRPLKELAPGGWTSVHVLSGPATGTRIERELGQPVEVDGDGTYGGDYVQDGDLLVFKRDEQIVRMISLGQIAAIADGEYPADIVLKGEDGSITMIDPGSG